MSVGFKSGGRLVTCATKDDIAFLPPEGVDEEGIWHIYTAEGLLAWRDAANADGSTCACLHSSLDMEGVDWEPVTTTFTGFFDGGGYSIKNLTWEATVSTTSEIARGLIVGEMTSGEVSNLTLINPKMSFENTSTISSSEVRCGLFVGYVNGDSCSVRNCHSYSGEISVTHRGSGNPHVGGVMGSSVGTVSSCTAAGCTITGTSESGTTNVGGVMGSSIGTASGCTATGCTVAATSASSTNRNKGAGGIVGFGYQAKTVGCIADSCDVSAYDSVGGTCAGGICAFLYRGCVIGCIVIADNNATATVLSEGTTSSFAGGILGRLYYQTVVSGCATNTGETSSALNVTATCESGTAYAGGIAGHCYNSPSSIMASDPKNAAVSASGTTAYVGGIAGYAPSNVVLSGNVNSSRVSADTGNG